MPCLASEERHTFRFSSSTTTTTSSNTTTVPIQKFKSNLLLVGAAAASGMNERCADHVVPHLQRAEISVHGPHTVLVQYNQSSTRYATVRRESSLLVYGISFTRPKRIVRSEYRYIHTKQCCHITRTGTRIWLPAHAPVLLNEVAGRPKLHCFARSSREPSSPARQTRQATESDENSNHRQQQAEQRYCSKRSV